MEKYKLEHSHLSPPDSNTDSENENKNTTATENKKTNGKKGKVSLKREILDWIVTIAVAALTVLIVQNFIIINADVPTGSMENTIMTNDRIIAFRLSYIFSEPQRGEAIVFKFPDDETQKYTKRIIGLPGETVEIRDGRVYINSSKVPLNEPYVKGDPTGDYGPYSVPDNCYFMMGDNRQNSLDSRFWQNTFVAKDKILGKVVFKYYKHPEIIDNKIEY